MQQQNSWKSVLLFARFALAAAFLSAVADRLGLWGKMGDLGVSWGNMDNFYRHVAKLSPWAPAPLIPALAWLVDILEAVLGVFLLLGVQLRRTAWASAALLLLFAISMAAFQSLKLSLNFSVLTCSACAFLVYLASQPQADAKRA
ncbi:MauE/DoxX family redox-associated membrane protein [Chromobacterium alticapitis]|uniref:Methylamine utilization protein MauE n=1 Tax=Chromobacterium alticapitis TaxID=2073169 RepID=A0A2S5DJK8_9NEIS|nr:MauE/DoxX family redox-associated membrane protein [Chromobacterium alticapitis]POZ63227.1 DoxX family protein [Chromobacterium alticapitis]